MRRVVLAVALAAVAVAGTIATPPTAARAASAAGSSSSARLTADLRALTAHSPGRYTIALTELDGAHRSVRISSRAGRYPASTGKLFIATGVYTRIDARDLHYGDRLRSGYTVRQCLRAMIEPSDNFCADDLRAKIGTAWLNGYLRDHGYRGTRFGAAYGAGADKVTTAADVALGPRSPVPARRKAAWRPCEWGLLERLATRRVLSAPSRHDLLLRLSTQVWREAIPPGLPASVAQASKPGTKYRASGVVQTDAAIVWGRSRYVLAVLGDRGASIPAITRMSRLVYTSLEGPIRHPFVYERQQMRTTRSLVLTRNAGGGAVLGRFGRGTPVEVIDSLRSRYLVRIGGRVGWVWNSGLVLAHRVPLPPGV